VKKTIAILLLTVHLFNFGGYALLYHYFIHQSDQRLAHDIELGNYDRESLTILKIPVHLPYYNGFKEFERVEGEIELNGRHYKYVERKISADTLFLACLPDAKKAGLMNSRNDYAAQVNDLPGAGKKTGDNNIKKNLVGAEYFTTPAGLCFSSAVIVIDKAIPFALTFRNPPFLTLPDNPPDQAEMSGSDLFAIA